MSIVFRVRNGFWNSPTRRKPASGSGVSGLPVPAGSPAFSDS